MEAINFDKKVKEWPIMRNAVIDLMDSSMKKHNVHGFGEIDVSFAREIIDKYKEKTKETLSFTAFIINCLGKAIDENKIMHATKKGKKLIIYEDVDVATIVEREKDGKKMPISYVIRSVNKRSYKEIHDDLRNAQTYDHYATKESIRFHKFLGYPKWLRKIVYKVIRVKPDLSKQLGGTVGVTAIGMFTRRMGWALPITPKTFTLTLGGIYKRYAVVEDKPLIREHLCVTYTIDHDIVDGGPASRFIMRFVELVESAYGLEDYKEYLV